MADGLTHVLLGWVAVELISIKYPWAMKYRALVLVGAILPDIGNFAVLMGETGANELYYLFMPLHSIVGSLLLVGVLTMIFKGEYRKKVFLLLTAGVATHLAADYFIIFLDGKVPLFFPFTFEKVGYDLFLQEGRGFLIVALVAVVVTVLRRKQVERKLKNLDEK